MWTSSCVVLAWFLVAAVKCQLIPCTTPNGETASCVPLLKCIVLIQAVCRNEPVALKFFSESVCDEKTSMVCCGTLGNFTKISATAKPLSEKEMFQRLSKEEKKDYVLKHLLPTTKICGLQHTDDYFYNSTVTSVDEFPWLVYISKRGEQFSTKEYYSRVVANCAGALISNRYVLSSDECLYYAQGYLTKVNMLLGVHHVYKTVNCIGTPFGVDDCTDPPLYVSSGYWEANEEGFVLLRLDNKIDYSDFVRPICLPLPTDQIPTAGSFVMASGWGEEEFVKGKSVKLKKRMRYTVMSNKDCNSNNVHQVRFAEVVAAPSRHPICGIPLENNTHYICTGDIGGPLMHKHMERNWFAVGLIFTIDYLSCDATQPVTARRLTPDVVNWIIENIKP